MAAKPMLRNRLACRIMASAWSTIGRGSFERGRFTASDVRSTARKAAVQLGDRNRSAKSGVLLGRK